MVDSFLLLQVEQSASTAIENVTNSFGSTVSAFLDNASSVLSAIILFVLALDSLRAVIAMLGIVPYENRFWGRLIYGRRDRELLKQVLKDLGYTEKEAVAGVKRLSATSREYSIPIEEMPLKLIQLIGEATIFVEQQIQYGNSGASKSHYYINLMGIAHKQPELDHLKLILHHEIAEARIDYDFYIVPKGGNILLAQKVASDYNKLLIIAKDKTDAARPKGVEEKYLDEINFEGLNVLLEVDKGRRLRGAVIDDNAAGGSQLLGITKGFNEIIRERNYKIEPITDCYVLFKLAKVNNKTNKYIDDDKQFREINCELHRYFDLSESLKAYIYNSVRNTTYYDSGQLQMLRNIFESINNENANRENPPQGILPTEDPAQADEEPKEKEASENAKESPAKSSNVK